MTLIQMKEMADFLLAVGVPGGTEVSAGSAALQNKCVVNDGVTYAVDGTGHYAGDGGNPALATKVSIVPV